MQEKSSLGDNQEKSAIEKRGVSPRAVQRFSLIFFYSTKVCAAALSVFLVTFRVTFFLPQGRGRESLCRKKKSGRFRKNRKKYLRPMYKVPIGRGHVSHGIGSGHLFSNSAFSFLEHLRRWQREIAFSIMEKS